jgi:3-hydroxyacyl-CoA dehydrogenase
MTSSQSSKHATEPYITLIGSGTIGLSFAALHLQHLESPSQLTIHDTRPDLQSYIESTLPKYLPPEQHGLITSIKFTSSKDALAEAVSNATIVQEQGPENAQFKCLIWAEIEKHARPDALLWSSTSGIPASVQSRDMKDKTRLIVVHPYNPPHIMPLLEVVPTPQTNPQVVERTLEFWRSRGREPVVIHKECTGFVANRLAFALLRESIHLVNEGIVSVEELDTIVQSSMGPRWAVAGPFKSYHAGGGAGGLEGFFGNIGGTVQACWDDAGTPNVGDGWEGRVFTQAKEAYGLVDTMERDRITGSVISAVRDGKKTTGS